MRKILLMILITIFVFMSFFSTIYATCGDGICGDNESCKECFQDCGSCCGNGIIESGETCSSCSQDVRCNHDQYCSNGVCINSCGDGKCDSGECSSCPQDCKLNQCIGNGECDTRVGERCMNSADCSCPRSYVCDINRPTSGSTGCAEIRCGDGYKDPGETQEKCCLDFGCLGDKKCFNNKCVECRNDRDCSEGRCSPKSNTCVRCIEDKDCGSNYCNTILNECVECYNDEHCSETTKWTDSFFCSPDFTKVMQRGNYVNGKCDLSTSKCIGNKQEASREYADCLTKGLYCQNGECGCDEGYSACTPLNKCVKIGNLDANEPCYCDFQCNYGFCYKNKCFEPMDVEFSLTKSTIEKNEETTLTLSVNNKLNEDIPTKFTINKGSGASFTSSSLGADICSGNQCTVSANVGAKSAKEVTVNLMGESIGETLLSATITYEFQGKTYSFKKELSKNLIIRGCGNSKCEEGETQRNCCIDCGMPNVSYFFDYKCKGVDEGYIKSLDLTNVSPFVLGIFTFLIIIFLAIRFGVPAYNKHKKKKEAKKEEKKQEKKKVKHKEKEEKSSKDSCSECGADLRDGIKFCTKCGKKIKEKPKVTFDKEGNIKEFKELKRKEKQAKKEWPVCQLCGGHLILRSGKYGKFYGCSNYPSCRYTKKYKK